MGINKSLSWNERLKNTMPHGSSTTSKKPAYLPEEPEVIVRGKGCRVWDEKGREFIDFRNSLGPITLGYCFPAVDEAITEQLKNGIAYGHPTTLECEVSEMLCEVIPCAEQARFLKTGGEACSAAIRIARAYTGREHIIQIGYNGWLNSLASGARVLPGETSRTIPGVPAQISALYHAAGWNDKETIEALFNDYHNNVAAVIVSADYSDFYKGAEFYPFLREITNRNGALLIFDEIVTGFRVAMGGVSEYFNVVPDLSVYAKGIANGMPLSAYVGKREIMKTCEMPGFSISSTLGGEALSLAACRAVINTYREHDVIGHIRSHGEYIWNKVNKLFEEKNIKIRLMGSPACPAIKALADAPEGLLQRFFRLAYKHHVSLYGTSYVNFSHSYEDLDEVAGNLSAAMDELQ